MVCLPVLTEILHYAVILKVHLTPKRFIPLIESTCYSKYKGKKILNLLESSNFCALSKSRLKCCTTEFSRESGAAVADDVYPGTKHNGASVSSLYLLENGRQN